jgi:ribosomal protein S21
MIYLVIERLQDRGEATIRRLKKALEKGGVFHASEHYTPPSAQKSAAVRKRIAP